MRNPQDIDISKDEEMRRKHDRVINIVYAAVTIFFLLLTIDNITTTEAVRAFIGTVLVLLYTIAGYWLGRADGEKKK